MTHRRMPGSVEAALIETLHELSEAEVRRATGKSLSTFYRASNPQLDAGLHLVDAAALDAALIARGHTPKLMAIGRRMKEQVLAELGGAPPHAPVHPLERLADVTAEIGDVAAALRGACSAEGPSGRTITAAEGATVLSEIRAARAALDAIERDVVASTVSVVRIAGAA
jgi:hypothetical protein